MQIRRRSLPLLALAAALGVAACGDDGGATEGAAVTGGAAGASGPLRVGASPVPHAEILRFVQDNLAQKAGLDLKIVEFTDYVQPNVALDEGQLDANYFQHQPYLDQQIKDAGYHLVAVEPVHLEPLGVYARKVRSVDALPTGATVAIPNDPTNGGRALRLLAAQGLIGLADTKGADPTVLDVASNPRKIRLTEVEAAQLPRSLQDVDAAVINGNYAIEAKLSPERDAIALESAQDNPYANLLVARQGNASDPRIATLAKLLHSPEVKAFIEKTYQGAVIPAF